MPFEKVNARGKMNYLFKLGYRRIGYLHYGGTDLYYYPIHALRLTDYYRLMAENGLKVEPGWVFHCSEHYENLPEGMDRILHSDPPPEALITPGSAPEVLNMPESITTAMNSIFSRRKTPFPVDDAITPVKIAEKITLASR